jgi:hypothetical protein
MPFISPPPSRPIRTAGRLAAAFLVLASLPAVAGRAQTASGYRDGVYHVSLDAIRKELAETKQFPATSASPSPYLSDFFGLQRIQDIPAEKIIRDLVPGSAQVASESPVLKLRFRAGFTAAYYLRCPFALDGNASPDFRPSFVEITEFAPTFKDRYSALAAFLALLEKAGLSSAYLVPNPYAELEKTAAADLASEARPRPAGWPQYEPGEREKKRADAIAGFDKATRAVLMFGDTHGSEEDYGAVWSFLNREPAPAFDWLGLEMLSRDQQALLDDYVSRAGGSPEFRDAERKLSAIFGSGWDKRFKDPGTPGDGHYFRLVKWARAHRVKVYALDAVPEYTLFRYGEFPLGSTTRNIVWADTVPLVGKGVVYGGSAHFVPLPATPFTFQDYIKRRDPGVALFY